MGVTIINHGACACCSDGPCSNWPGLPDMMMLPLLPAVEQVCSTGNPDFNPGTQHFSNANGFIAGREEVFPYTGTSGSSCVWFQNAVYPTGTVSTNQGTYNSFLRVNLRFAVGPSQVDFYVIYNISIPAITAYPNDTCGHNNQFFYRANPSNMNDYLSQPSFTLNYLTESVPGSPVLDNYGPTIEIFRA